MTNYQALAIAVALGGLVAGCRDEPVLPAGLTERVAQAALPSEREEYYLAGAVKVQLRRVPGRYVLETADGASLSRVSQLLVGRGAGLRIVDELAVPGHRVVELGGGAADPAADEAFSDPGVAFLAPLYESVVDGDRVALVNRLVVQFHPEVPRSRIDSLAAAHGLELLRPPRPDSGSYEYWFRYPRRVADPLEIAISVGSNDAVMWADPDKVQDRRPQLVPSDAYYSSQWHLKSATSYNGIPVDINAESAWNLTTGSSAVRVAVIDDGVDALHASELLNAFSGANGYDLMAALSSGDGVFNPYGNDTHGTSIAGLIFARHGDGGVAGIAPGTRMNVARIFRRSYDLPQNRQTASDADIANAINWAWQSVASDVISNSWGGGAPSAAIDQAIVNATTLGRGGKGTVVVFSAGNHPAAQPNKPVTYPATHPSVIAVSAIGPSGTRASYSAQGNEVDIAALSGDLTGTCIGALVTIDLWSYDGCNDFPGDANYTNSFSGTSGAAPQVSAVAALLLSREPSLTLSEVKQRLYAAARPWGAATDFGFGKLDAYRTIVGAPTAVLSGPTTVRAGQTCRWTVTPAGGLTPYSYFWTLNGAPIGTNSPELVISVPSVAFTVAVTVQGANSAGVTKSKNVSVSAGAPLCLL